MSAQFTSSMTLHILLNLAESQFPQLQNKESKISSVGLLRGSDRGAYCLAEHTVSLQDTAVTLCSFHYCCHYRSYHYVV